MVVATTGRAVGKAAPKVLRLRPPGRGFCTEANDDTAPCGYVPPLSGRGLKAGPLLGVWATGPYLHNGSVRTVYQLLSPPEERETTFLIGDRRIDAVHLGFEASETPDAFLFDTRLPGNGKEGHVFWETPFRHEERLALIEYLKEPARFPLPGDRGDGD